MCWDSEESRLDSTPDRIRPFGFSPISLARLRRSDLSSFPLRAHHAASRGIFSGSVHDRFADATRGHFLVLLIPCPPLPGTALAVALGAFGAHGLKAKHAGLPADRAAYYQDVWKTAASYHLLHSAVMAVGTSGPAPRSSSSVPHCPVYPLRIIEPHTRPSPQRPSCPSPGARRWPRACSSLA